MSAHLNGGPQDDAYVQVRGDRLTVAEPPSPTYNAAVMSGPVIIVHLADDLDPTLEACSGEQRVELGSDEWPAVPRVLCGACATLPIRSTGNPPSVDRIDP